MQKIKFKIEYKPLSDQAINQYKNFDGLMAMYAAIPKPNLFQRIFKNRWTMFSGGIIIGSAITALIALNSGNNHTESNILFIQQPVAAQVDEKNEVAVDQYAENTNISSQKNIIAEAKQNLNESISSPQINSSNTQSVSNNNNADKNEISLNGDENKNPTEEKITAVNEINAQDNFKQPIQGTQLVSFEENGETGNEEIDPVVSNNNSRVFTTSPVQVYELPEPKAEQNIIAGIENDKSNLAVVEEKKSGNKKEDNEVVNDEENKSKEKASKEEKVKNDATANNDESNKITILDKIFDGKPEEQEIKAGLNADVKDTSALHKEDEFINRYAQLSFFTPLSTNGIDSYKYKHYVSFNIIQGFNGAVNGAEFGGVLNLDKGYMTGGQFAGVANLVGGEVKGFQGAGVMNISKTVTGFQGAGVVNTVVGNMTGFQGAGVMNIAVKKLNGFQAAGVLNINTSLDTSTFWQAAGVANFSVAHSTGAQTAGVLNIANDHTGAQIGLINFSKKITGTQIGLINIADSIDGAAIGLLSFSRNGIFDIDISTNDFMPLNAAVRVGGPLIYNIFTFGITPSADTATYAYGIGIGGEIPFDKFYVDIDAIGWNIHQDKFEFDYEYFHMNNQLRVTPGYKINKFISVYAGPVVNVEIYDNAIVPLHTNPIREFAGSAFTTNISAGYVAGIRFF
jgi:hypothetical protein